MAPLELHVCVQTHTKKRWIICW